MILLRNKLNFIISVKIIIIENENYFDVSVNLLRTYIETTYKTIFVQAASPACTELEVITTDWLGKMLALPEEFLHCGPGNGGGVIQVLKFVFQIIKTTTLKSKS